VQESDREKRIERAVEKAEEDEGAFIRRRASAGRLKDSDDIAIRVGGSGSRSRQTAWRSTQAQI
jgi:hypothetical protein